MPNNGGGELRIHALAGQIRDSDTSRRATTLTCLEISASRDFPARFSPHREPQIYR
ncbi:DUF2188 domain-containing protein [Mycobacterium simiae]|uniref:DUF2188 domain-containing protein n=1 Tax=Mycobacterium simiae TaxID=1784 RepID=UPI001E5D1498|nr:DUF2188 domain-containing protein [Mycobacterium simiae]